VSRRYLKKIYSEIFVSSKVKLKETIKSEINLKNRVWSEFEP
jgi:hypothetical protein